MPKPYTDARHRLGSVPTNDHTAVELQQFEHTVEFEGDAHGTNVSFLLFDKADALS